MGCEPTYEELKLNKKEEEKSKRIGCEPTYEELKQLKKGGDKI